MVSAEVDSGAGRFRRWERRRDPEHPRNLKRIRERDDHRQAHRFHLEFPRKKKRMRVAGCSHRKWAYSPCDLSSYNDRFIIVSYNILGDENVSKHSDLYSNVPPEHLCWEKRKNRICKELRSCNPSILCFQEVDHYDELADLLHKDGYTGVYKGRTGCTRDGCAIFWKEERFSLLYEENIEYQKYGLRDNVAQLCLLQGSGDDSNHSTTGNTNPSSAGCRNMMLLVGNIHVLFNPNRGDVKLGQIRLLLERANTISQNWGNPSMVICGDLNSIPQSAIYQFISSPELDILKYERKKVSGQIELQSRIERHTSYKDGSSSISCMGKLLRYSWSDEEICIAGGKRDCTLLQNPLKLSSAYTGVPGNLRTRDRNGEPLVTSFHSKFMGTVDYIWHSSDLLPVRVLETLPINELKELGCLPCEKWGSDHLSLVCEFAFANGTKSEQDSL
ncbi:hypothetical protein HPP92_004824 [Vanilla planifolia]|uniref:Endonuclease/exonuclease/phosphatase domain-containing protein n=1 Tax=Vanilla planifolia TaxID=51239 RepID=A0A835VCM4_VANPL|nr:hypothetical protein HPP92_004824 [Vanilla planifolia]